MPNDKAPGLDGFTGIFYKKAWPIIKKDILNAFNAILGSRHQKPLLA